MRLAVSRREDAEFLVTRVEDVNGAGLEVLTPMRKLRATQIPTGTRLQAAYVYQRKRWRFTTQVTGASADGSLLFLGAPDEIECSERRSSFRLETSIKPQSLYRLVIDPEDLPEDVSPNIIGTVVDLSEGGLCLSTPARLISGERLGIQAALGEGQEFTARMQVTGVDDPHSGQRNRRVHCRFTDISRADRERVAKYLMRRQLEMRRRGQL